MSRYVTVRLTEPQAEALISAVAYCTAGDPEDIGFENNAEGFRVLRAMEAAKEKIHAASRRSSQ